MIGPVAGADVPASVKAAERRKLESACAQLEGVFMNELAKALRDTVPQDGVLDSGTGGEMFTSMLDEKLAELAAARSQSGLTTALVKQLGKRA